jgi:hypothetical protein
MAEQMELNETRFYRAGLREMISQTGGRGRIEAIEIDALSSNVR